MNVKTAPFLTGKSVSGRLTALLLFAMTGCAHCPDDLTLVPGTWNPSLQQAGEFMDGMTQIPSMNNQRFLSDASQNLADIYDAQLFIVYIRLMQALDTDGRIRLFQEQQQWLARRQESAKEAVISKGGSLAPMEYNIDFRNMTETRLAELQKKLTLTLKIIQNYKGSQQ